MARSNRLPPIQNETDQLQQDGGGDPTLAHRVGRLEGTMESLAQEIARTNKNLDRYAEQASNAVADMGREIGKLRDTLGQRIGEIHDRLGQAVSGMSQEVRAEARPNWPLWATGFTILLTILIFFLTRHDTFLSKLEAAQEKIVDQRVADLEKSAKQSVHFDTEISALRQQFADLNRTLDKIDAYIDSSRTWRELHSAAQQQFEGKIGALVDSHTDSINLIRARQWEEHTDEIRRTKDINSRRYNVP